MDNRQEYVDKICVGSLIAFKISLDDKKLISGKVTSKNNGSLHIQTKNGTNYVINEENVAWVNTNGRWPKGVMNAFKIRLGEGTEVEGEEYGQEGTGDRTETECK